MTVRFATGLSVQYNDACYVVRNGDGTKSLYTSSDKSRWLVDVPADAIVEGVRPCRVYQAARGDDQLTTDMIAALDDPRAREKLSGSDLARIKRALQSFNATTRQWR